MTTKSLILDVWQKNHAIVKANQGEVNSRFLEITLTDKSVPLDLMGKSVFFYATKPDSNVIYNLCEIQDVEKGMVSVCLTSQMSAVAGKMPCEIHIIDNEKSTLKVVGLELEIAKCADLEDAVESKSEFTALEKAMAEYNTISEKIDFHLGSRNNPHKVTTAQIGAVPTSRTINSKNLSSDIELNCTDIGAATADHNHAADEITSGTLPISRGGTGSTTSSSALSNLGGVPKTRTINSKALSSNIELNCTDIGAASYEEKSSADFNEMKTPGLYTMRSCTTNAPTSGSYHSLIVNKSDNGDYVQQIAIKESSHEIYTRYLNGSTWSEWKQISTEEHIQTVDKGGTGATTVSGALENLGAAASSHNHSASSITSGTLPISRGGTGATSASSALSNLGGVPKTRTINSKALSSDIELNCTDIGAASYEIKNNVDFNEMKTPGLYTMRDSSTNAPSSGSYHSLIVNKSDTGNYVQQIAIKESSHEIYTRYLSGSSWSAWKQISTEEHMQTVDKGGTGATTAANARTNLGVKGDVLYNNSSGTFGTVTLSASASNYNYLVIYFRNYNNQFGSIKIYSPNGKTTSLELNDRDSSQGWFSRGCTATISGSSITLSNQIQAYISSNAAWSTLNGAIKITRVEGWLI